MNEPLYTVRAIDGDFRDFVDDVTIETLKYDNLTWPEAVSLCRLSFAQGFQCIIWETAEDTGGADDGKKESGGKM